MKNRYSVSISSLMRLLFICFVLSTCFQAGTIESAGAEPAGSSSATTSSATKISLLDQAGVQLRRLIQATGELRLKSRGVLNAGSYVLAPGLSFVCATPTDVQVEFALPAVAANLSPTQRSLNGKVQFSPAILMTNSSGDGVPVTALTIADNAIHCECSLGLAFQNWMNGSASAVTNHPLDLDSFSSFTVEELFWKPNTTQVLAVGPASQNTTVAFGPDSTILVSDLKRLPDKSFKGTIKLKVDRFGYETSSPAPSKFVLRSLDTSFSLVTALKPEESVFQISKPESDRIVKLEELEAVAAPGRLQLAKADISFEQLRISLKSGENPQFALKSGDVTCKGIELISADNNNQLSLASSTVALPGELLVKGRTWHLDGATVQVPSARAKVIFPNKTFELPIHNAKVDLGELNGNEVSEDVEVRRASLSVKKDWEIFPENKVRTGHVVPITLAKNSHFHIDQAGALVCRDWQAKLMLPRLLFEKDNDHFELNDAAVNLSANVDSSALSTISMTARANGLQIERQNFKPAKLSKIALLFNGKLKVDRTNQGNPKIALEEAIFSVPSDRLNGLLTAVVPKNVDLASPGANVTDSGVSQLVITQVKPETSDFYLRATGVFHKGISGPIIIGNPLKARNIVIQARIKRVAIDNLPSGKFLLDPDFDKCEVAMPGFFDPIFWFFNKTQITQKIAEGFMDKFEKNEISPPDFLKSLVVKDPEISSNGIKVRFACELKN